MKIIISPAKKMNIDDDIFEYRSKPVFFEQAEEIMNYMKIYHMMNVKLFGNVVIN